MIQTFSSVETDIWWRKLVPFGNIAFETKTHRN